MKRLLLAIGLLAAAAAATSCGNAPSCCTCSGGACLPAVPRGRFVRSYWFEPGIEYGNPMPDPRFRVNSPEAAIGRFKDRREVRASGMMQIPINEDLALLDGAELYLEVWGGHPGTAGKRVTINGRTTYLLPRVGTERGHCTHQYPTLPLKVTDVVAGYNALQFACDQGQTFWGHFIVDNACLRAILKADHPDLAAEGLAGFTAKVKATVSDRAAETIRLQLEASAAHLAMIESVDFEGRYRGYDENGSGSGDDWHGFTKNRQPQAIIGSSDQPPFAVPWDVSMLPDQADMAVRAVVHLKGQPAITYRTAAVEGLRTPDRKGARVTLRESKNLAAPLWSRASKGKTCTIVLNDDPGRIERVQLHMVVWDGGAGDCPTPVTLNGRPLDVVGKGGHDVVYRVLDLDPAWLVKGANEVTVMSTTEHHGIEVLLPGPALAVRTRSDAR